MKSSRLSPPAPPPVEPSGVGVSPFASTDGSRLTGAGASIFRETDSSKVGVAIYGRQGGFDASFFATGSAPIAKGTSAYAVGGIDTKGNYQGTVGVAFSW